MLIGTAECKVYLVGINDNHSCCESIEILLILII